MLLLLFYYKTILKCSISEYKIQHLSTSAVVSTPDNLVLSSQESLDTPATITDELCSPSFSVSFLEREFLDMPFSAVGLSSFDVHL